MIFRIAIFAFALLLACPLRFTPFMPTIDGSWLFGINLAAQQGLHAGIDLIWTTGPFAYLTTPTAVGDNLVRGLIFQLVLWVILAWPIYRLVFARRVPLLNLIAFVVGFSLAQPLFYFNYVGVDYLITTGFYLLLLESIDAAPNGAGRWVVPYLVALVLAALASMIKFTALIVMLGGVAMTVLVIGWLDRKRGIRAAVLAASVVPALTLVFYLLHNPSISGFFSYIRGAGQITDGFSTAMSVPPNATASIIAAGLWIIMLVLGALLATRDYRAFATWLVVLPGFFLAFKHGYTRADEHVVIFLAFAPLAIGLVLLTADLPKLGWMAGAVGFPVVAVWLYGVSDYHVARQSLKAAAGITALNNVWKAIRLDETIRQLQEQGGDPVETQLLKDLCSTAGDRTIVSLDPIFLPLWPECSGLQLLPVVQTYSAYSPDLDARNAEWIRQRRPEYVVTEFFAIDSHSPTLERPQTEQAVRENYSLAMTSVAATTGARHHQILLQRRTSARQTTERVVNRVTIPSNGWIVVPQEATHARVQWPLTLSGRLVKLFYQIPDVWLEADRDLDKLHRNRVAVGLLAGAWPLNFAIDANQYIQWLGSKEVLKIRRFRFDGPGTVYYAPQMQIEWLRLESSGQ